MSNGYDVRRLQLRLLDNLIDIDRVCRENNLTYYLLAGTMLGAVRHQGFIPWDDDLDIGMPRKDYDRFFEIAKQCLPEYLELKNYTSHPNYSWWFMKIEDKRTTLVEKKHFNYTGGVFIDIFPLDGVTKNVFSQRLHFERVKYINKLRYFRYRDPYKHGRGIRSWPSRIVNYLYSRDFLQRKIEKLIRQYDYETSTLVCDHDGGTTSLMPKANFGIPTPIMFEGKVFMGCEKPHDYLKSVYGDYMIIPPENKRATHHFYFLDLDKPYAENQGNIK